MGDELQIHKGLDGVYIAESTICKVDGAVGRLYYRGYSIGEIAENSTYEEVAYLLIHGRLPKAAELEEFSKRLKAERDLPAEVVRIIQQSAGKSDPMDILRTAVSYLSISDNEVKDQSYESNIRKSIRLISKISSIVAATGRIADGGVYVKPDSALSHSENFVYMLKGRKPTKEEIKPVEMMFMLQAEHSTNASTFAALVAGSTLADLYSAVTSGIAALKGPLHGGADEEALRMMYAIGDPSNTEQYINEALAGKKKIMGFGHRVYKAYDPRAKIIKEYLLTLQNSSSEEVRRLTEIALRGEKLMIDKLGASHGIWPNVDFFAGPVYISAGIKIDLFTPMFAASRIAGWCAHVLEYWEDNKLIRPLELYKGQIDLKYVPIDKR
ncbi:citrate synthase/methylcitrate synthase [Candidatus Marsarchaeota archaeon]|jgi:citrate synthase|nr:citrate synthase/methylcitrate synthase [Candidatus Marsarchaeota archaeon]